MEELGVGMENKAVNLLINIFMEVEPSLSKISKRVKFL